MFHALARGVAAVIPNSMQKAAMNDEIVRGELKTLVREIFGEEYTVEQKRMDALGFSRMATDLPMTVLHSFRNEFEAACLDKGYDPTSHFKVLESAVVFGYWCGMAKCPHWELDQFFDYTRSEHFQSTRMSLRHSSNFLGVLGAFTR